MKAAEFLSKLSEQTIREQARLMDEAVNTFLTENDAPCLADVGSREKLERAGFILKFTQSYHGNVRLDLFKKVSAIQLETEISTRVDSIENKVVIKKVKVDL